MGTAACVSCHEAETAGFLQHGMGRSFHPLQDDDRTEQYPGPFVVDSATGLRYRALLEAGRPAQEETLVDAEGRVVHRLVRAMDFVMGSGNTARTYFSEAQGWLFQMPLTWYAQSGRWDFSPGYDQANGRFGRVLPDRCMACHNGMPEPVEQTNGKYASFPMGITCEQCHGPGSLHVAERLADPEPAGEVDDSIVNPAHLPAGQRFDVCQQCHLNGTVSLLRDGRSAYDFRPGQDLADHLSIFVADHTESVDEIGVISHVERLTASACFTETPGGLECTTCHDPHAGSPEPAVFGAICMDCHAPGALPADDTHADPGACIACHMPRVDAEEAPHSSFTDHWIRVVSSRDVAAAHDGEGSPDDGLRPYFDRDRADSAAAYRGMARIVLGRQRNDPGLVRAGRDLLASIGPDGLSGEASFLLGVASLDTGDPKGAVAPLEAAVREAAGRAERLNALAQAWQATGRSAEAIERLYRQALEIQPARGDVRVNYGRFLESRGRLDEALAQYRTAAEEGPWQSLAWFNVGAALLRTGDLSGGRAAIRISLNLDPTRVEAWGNLGASFAQEGRIDSARTAFERAVRIVPGSALARGNLGALYVNLDDLDRAIPELERAVAIDPQYVDALANLALAYVREDRPAEALDAARRALAIDPANELARQVELATQ